MQVKHPASAKHKQNNALPRTLSMIELARKEQEALDTRFAAAALDYQAGILKQYLQTLPEEFAHKSVQEYEQAKHEIQIQIEEKTQRAQQLAQLAQQLNSEMQQYNNAYFQQTYGHFINQKATAQGGVKGMVPFEKVALNIAGHYEAGIEMTKHTDFYFKGVELRNGKHFVYAALRLPIEYLMPVTEVDDDKPHLSKLADHILTGTDYVIDTLMSNGFKSVRPPALKIEAGCEMQLECSTAEGKKQVLYLYGGKAHPSRRGWVVALREKTETIEEGNVPSYLLLSSIENDMTFLPKIAGNINLPVENFGFTQLPETENAAANTPGYYTHKDGYILSDWNCQTTDATVYTLEQGKEEVFLHCTAHDAHHLLTAIFKNVQTAAVAVSGLNPAGIGFSEIGTQVATVTADRIFAHIYNAGTFLLIFNKQNTAEYLAGWTLIAEEHETEQQTILATGMDDIMDTGNIVAEKMNEFKDKQRSATVKTRSAEAQKESSRNRTTALNLFLVAVLGILMLLFLAHYLTR